MIWTIAHKWHRKNPNLDLDDLYAEVRLGFVEAAKRYDPARGAKFATYAAWHGSNRVRQYVRQEVAGGQHVPQYVGMVRVVTGSIDIPAGVDGDETRGANAVAPVPEERPEFPADLWERVRAVVTAAEFAALVGWFRKGQTLTAIGHESGVCRERVRQRLAKAFEKVRRELPELESHLEA